MQKRDFGKRIELNENISFPGRNDVDLIALDEAFEAWEKSEKTPAQNGRIKSLKVDILQAKVQFAKAS